MKLPILILGITLSISSHVKTQDNAILSTVTSTAPSTQLLEVEYKTFYSHTRKLSGDDITALRFAFGFTNIHAEGALCHIDNAYIHTQKVDIPLIVSAEQRFSIPSEKALRLADAKIMLAIREQTNHCDINVQIETLPEYLKEQYTQADMSFILNQYMAFFDEMGGFMSFLMPQVSGLQLRFEDDNLNAELGNQLTIVQGILRLSKAQ
ncbi:MAG: DUF2987 domain-containing protein, partial [Cellvibrionales bacterium]|nr:DUF2987 domain-containing protein [Cellvibrionales bacterium]